MATMITLRPNSNVTKLILLTTQRSGSTYVRLWLNSHPYVRCHSEIFYREYPAADGFKAYCEANRVRHALYRIFGKRKRSRSPRNLPIKWLIGRFLHELYHNPNFSAPWTDMSTEAWIEYQPRKDGSSEKVVGFQLMYDQLANYRPLQEWATRPEVFILHLIRENALKLLISRMVAKKTGEYQFARRKGPRPKVYLDPAKTMFDLSRIMDLRERMRKKFSGNPYLEITYERFFSEYPVESEKVFAFLGIPKAEMEFPTFLKKLNPSSLEELVENYDEIVTALQGTRYERFLQTPEEEFV